MYMLNGTTFSETCTHTHRTAAPDVVKLESTCCRGVATTPCTKVSHRVTETYSPCTIASNCHYVHLHVYTVCTGTYMNTHMLLKVHIAMYVLHTILVVELESCTNSVDVPQSVHAAGLHVHTSP